MKKYMIMGIITLLGSAWSYAQTLDGYFNIAAENNPGLQAKYKEYEAALQKVSQVSTLPDPVFSFGYFISPVETRVGPQRVRLSLTQIFPWFGTLKAQGDAAALMAEAKFQAFIDARNNMYYQVAAAYYPLFELNQWKSIQRENIEILQSYHAVAIKNFESGNGAMVDVLRVDMMLKDAVTDLRILNAKEKPLATAFNKLLNRNENEPIATNDALAIESLPENFGMDSLLADNPVLKELDLKIKASEASERAAYKQGLPKFGIGLDYVVVDERTEMTLPDNGKDVLMPMVTVTIPIFRAKYRASVKEAQLMQKSYSLQKEEFANSLGSSYEMLRFEIQQQRALLALYEQQIQTTRQTLNLLFVAYSNSGKAFEDVLSVQQQLLKYRKLKATAEVQCRLALAKLHYLRGRTYENENN